MADNADQTPRPGTVTQAEAAERVLENLAELEPELKAAAILDDDGKPVASSGSDSGWAAAAKTLLISLESVRKGPVDSAHLATDEAEIFVVREAGLSLIAVTGRFVLASLTSFDMRMALRDVARGAENGKAENA